jgi:hypothetical protein
MIEIVEKRIMEIKKNNSIVELNDIINNYFVIIKRLVQTN